MKVKFYSTMPSDNENVLLGISPKIPAVVVNTDTFPDYPIDETYTLMTNEQYSDYINSIQSELAEWKTIQDNQY